MAEKLTKAAQENLIALLGYSNKHGKIIAQLADPELFEGDYRVIATRAVDYWKKHKQAPRAHMTDLLSDVIHDGKNRRAETYKRILRSMRELAQSGEINTDYVMQQLSQFTRLQKMKDAILRSAEILQKQQELGITDVEGMLGDLLRAREFNFDSGLRLADAVPRVADHLENRFSEFPLGIKHLDARNIVPHRGAVFLFLAPTGRGKSWFLIRAGRQALLQRKRVLHITLEMDEDATAQRYFQSFFAMPTYEIEGGVLNIAKLRYEPVEKGHERKFIRAIENQEVKANQGLSGQAGMKLLSSKVQQWRRTMERIIIKRFPTRSITVDDLRGYLDTLEASTGFVPDMMLLDYIGIMRTDVKNHRISLGRTFEDFRGLMQERNMAGVTASQVGRVGMEARTLKATHVAEDISLINTSDISVTYSQTDAERQLGLARLFVDKARADEDKFGVVVTQRYSIGQFALQSALLNSSYYDLVEPPSRDEGDEGDED